MTRPPLAAALVAAIDREAEVRPRRPARADGGLPLFIEAAE